MKWLMDYKELMEMLSTQDPPWLVWENKTPLVYDVCMDGLRSSWHKVEVSYDSGGSLAGLATQVPLVTPAQPFPPG